jgi:hypothetical protein
LAQASDITLQKYCLECKTLLPCISPPQADGALAGRHQVVFLEEEFATANTVSIHDSSSP